MYKLVTRKFPKSIPKNIICGNPCQRTQVLDVNIGHIDVESGSLTQQLIEADTYQDKTISFEEDSHKCINKRLHLQQKRGAPTSHKDPRLLLALI